MKEKLITDNAYGLTKSEAKKGYSDQTVKEKNDWMEEFDKDQTYRKRGFGRATGHER